MIVNIGSWSMVIVIADNTGLLENKSHCHMHQILCILLSDHGFGLNGHLHHLHHRRAADERIRRGKTVLHHHHSFLQHLTMNDFVSNTRWNTLCCSTALRSLTSSQSTSSPLSVTIFTNIKQQLCHYSYFEINQYHQNYEDSVR